ncbi:MAG: LCP family protein [Actinomycetota bacterium]
MKLRTIALMLTIGSIVALWPVLGPTPRTAAAPIKLGKVHEGYQPLKGKIFVLLIGHDARPGETRARADGIHIAGINTETMTGGILNFPRDSWVNIPGWGSARINDALYIGGPERLAETLEDLTGITIDYWVMAGFEQFQSLVEDLGGIRMNVPTAVYDRGGSGAQLDAGMQKLKGYEALAYARARKPFSDGDVVRTTNQARIFIAALKKLRQEVGNNPAALLRWMSVIREHAELDMSASDTFRLGVVLSQLSAKKVGNVTIPVNIGMAGSASVVFISPQARPIYARFKRTGSL